MDPSILVVDDEQMTLDTIRRGLLTSGFKKVTMERDYARATDMIACGATFDVALLGISLSTLHGLEFLELLKRHSARTVCIVFTAINDAEFATECLKKGASDYLLKPLTRERMADAIRKAAAKPSSPGPLQILILEDDPLSGKLMKQYLEPYGPCDLVTNGGKAVEAFERALNRGAGYGLVFLDIMVPEISGREVLGRLRALESGRGIPPHDRAKIIMTTALDDADNIIQSFKSKADSYLVKPIRKEKIEAELKALGVAPCSAPK